MHLKRPIKNLEVLVLFKKNSGYDVLSLEKSFMLSGQLDGGSGADGGGEGGGEGEKGDSASKAELEKLKTESELLKAENERLSDHNKKVIEEKRLETEAKRKLDEEKAIKDNDLEAYRKSSDAKIKVLEDKIEASNNANASKEVRNQALELATNLATGSNIKLLSTFIEKRLRVGEGGVEVLDEKGDLSVLSLDDLQAEFSNNAEFASLLKGRDSSGGGAKGSEGSGATEGDKKVFGASRMAAARKEKT